MRRKAVRASRGLLIASLAASVVAAGAPADRSDVADRITRLTRDATWRRTAAVPVAFRTYHPQGMVKVGDTFFVSSVEIKVPTRRIPRPDGSFGRDTGEGIGHLFQLDANGSLIRSIRLGEGTIYHPGGIDFDGTHIWVPVAEYRPDSRPIVYRIDARSMTATEVLRFSDHLGAIVHDTDSRRLHGVSWGSRRFYQWKLSDDGGVLNAGTPERTSNPSHYVDYQDCKYVGARRMLCSGVADVRREASAGAFAIGGVDLIDLADGRPLHQVPVLLWTTTGLAMTRNPVWFEGTEAGLRAYFMPEDDASTLYVYEVETR
jgi:hypothetical protein